MVSTMANHEELRVVPHQSGSFDEGPVRHCAGDGKQPSRTDNVSQRANKWDGGRIQGDKGSLPPWT